MHLNVTANPTAAWIRQPVLEATPWGRQPRYLVHDRDTVYGADFVRRARRLGIRTLRNDCLDHLIILNEQHLRAVLAEFVRYYNTERPTGACCSTRPGPSCGPRLAQSTRGPFSAGCIMSTSARAEHGPIFPPLQLPKYAIPAVAPSPGRLT